MFQHPNEQFRPAVPAAESGRGWVEDAEAQDAPREFTEKTNAFIEID